MESWQNGYCTGLENRRPQGLGGSQLLPLSLPYPFSPIPECLIASHHAKYVTPATNPATTSESIAEKGNLGNDTLKTL